jgi:RimJ/RimL family protein N-acetyltransferase
LTFPLKTDRLILRPWRPSDRDAFAALNADPEVMHDLGGPLTRAASDAKLGRYISTFERHGCSRLVIEDQSGFVGYAGVMPAASDHPLAPHAEIGWRLVRAAWGKGYATEAARAALDDAFARLGLDEVLAYTAIDNRRSQAVMERLGLRREPLLDFDVLNDDVPWHGLVWVAEMRRP